MVARLELSRSQILSFRRKAGALDERLPSSVKSLRRAAWAGLQDSAPRAALLSIHARVEGASSSIWEHPSFVQIWGPRFNVYVVAAKDLAIFSLGRLPTDAKGLARARSAEDRLRTTLDGQRMTLSEAGRMLRVQHNSLRYAAPTGTVLLRWDGARQPVIWTAAPLEMGPEQAGLELARRYLRVFGPASDQSFGAWAGIRRADAIKTFQSLAGTLIPVQTPRGDSWILAEDEAAFLENPEPPAPARLLPSGDAYYLLWGADRSILVPEAKRRAELWTTRVWPGALLVNGEIAGVWRRSAAEISLQRWRPFSSAEREAVEIEATALPLPGLNAPISIHWT